MEVERYTLATGETAVTGFTRLWKSWWFLFVLMAIVPNVWPGFATGAATCLSAIKLRGYRLAIMCVAVVWFGYFSTRVIIEYAGKL
jgi:hypothetical protein